MAVDTPLGTFVHDQDSVTGAERFLVSLDLVSLTALLLVWLLSVRFLRAVRSG